MTKRAKPKKPERRKTLATGGGNATASGVSFQASVAAYIAAYGLARMPLDPRLSLGAAKVEGFRLETEAPVDDILISTDAGGWVFIQCKNRLTNSVSLTSEIGKTCDEFARLWELCSAGTGALGWDRPLKADLDALVIAVGPATSAPIKLHLPQALNILRDGSTATLSNDQKAALTGVRNLMKKAIAARGGVLASVSADTILKFIHVIEFDFGGGHRHSAEVALAGELTDRSKASAALSTLAKEFDDRMSTRNGIALAKLRAVLARSGVPVAAPPDYRSDVLALKNRSEKVASLLQDFERTQAFGVDVNISRACTTECVSAAEAGSLVVVGDPGAGKSAVLNETARRLVASGNDVVLLAVDRLQVDSAEGLKSELGISHRLADVLANWPGPSVGYLVLDALDACRFGRSEALFRGLIREVLELDEGRWRAIASIRTFDLEVGQEFGKLFRGIPPCPAFSNPKFQTVRHIRVPEWSDEEFDQIQANLPSLREAVNSGGAKLAELSRVPFNTRLLAELLTVGVAAEQLKDLGSQVQLLEMYWNARVKTLGAPGEQCLSNTINAMMDRGRMDAKRNAAGINTGDALDQLLRQGVLISVGKDQEVAFRHHILFDYVASRTIIDLEDKNGTEVILKRTGASLLLAPALSFALLHLWEISHPSRDRFWQVAVDLAGAPRTDPVVRNVATRVACEVPVTAEDAAGFIRLIGGATVDEAARKAFAQVVGSLAVRLEDDPDAPLAPWCSVAEAVAPLVATLAWPLRTLVHNLIDRTENARFRRQIGSAARAVMDYAFNSKDGAALMPPAIGFVAKTFSSEPDASRKLILRLLEQDRMDAHASEDMHWLANAIKDFEDEDTELVVQIYDLVFSRKLKENATTQIGNSKILTLTSNQDQDFKMAHWSLKTNFGPFAKKHPLAAVNVAIAVARGAVLTKGQSGQAKNISTMTVDCQTGRIIDDYSYIWAARHRAEHPSDAEEIIDIFVDLLASVPDELAVAMADRLINENTQGWLWNRLLMAANMRGGVLADKLWPWAAQIELLRSRSTAKEAVELLASGYGKRSSDEKQAVEAAVLKANFTEFEDPEEAALRFQRRIFGTIERGALATSAAIAIVDGMPTAAPQGSYQSPDDFNPTFYGEENHGWLRERGVDIQAEPDKSILAAIATCDNVDFQDIAQVGAPLAAAAALYELIVHKSSDAQALVILHGWQVFGRTIDRMAHSGANLQSLSDPQRAQVDDLLESMNRNLANLPATDEGMLAEAREHRISAVMNILRKSPEGAKRFANDIRAAARSEQPDIREKVAAGLVNLWNADQDLMWELADGFAKQETEPTVCGRLASFLICVSNHAPDRVDTLTQSLVQRENVKKTEGRDVFRQDLGTLIFHLWVCHGRISARKTLDLWLQERIDHETELRQGAFSIRTRLVIGYNSTSGEHSAKRSRAQSLAFEIVDLTAGSVQLYYALDKAEQTEKRRDLASSDIALLDQMSDQFFFAVGIPQTNQGHESAVLKTPEQKMQYLLDNEKTFRRIGDAGYPKTIYDLFQLLDFLMPGNSAIAFDLVCHALLNAGKLHGYQSEQLGSDQFVKMIGKTIADYRDLFADTEIRLMLVAVLEFFVDAGWPAARRLLYHLPEALR
ncbi:hypothetical protein PY365_27115 [Roseiarcaceae bacterium H3SJ34-1]|uniref:hypothetical protein n=1 Tax=Terripilifer ovatus TaxID=3032367 RepID=UPI003AB951D7|nr:hypothetical protein [Roseiarcaceae bacterium H3SJ34-1]